MLAYKLAVRMIGHWPIGNAEDETNWKISLGVFAAMIFHHAFWLPLIVLLSGCMAPPIKAASSGRPLLRTLLVVPVETQPLEIFPDFIVTRRPTYRHLDNMAIPLFLEKKIYRSSGGILIAGQTDPQDDIVAAAFSTDGAPSAQYESLQALSSRQDDWVPTRALSAEAESQLHDMQVSTVTNRHWLRLALPENKRNANIGNWRSAIKRWYERDVTTTDYRQAGADSVDAVLEIGIRQYKIYGGQTTLQVLLKVINPANGQVLARTSQTARSLDASAEYLLSQDGAKFKSLILDNGKQLLAQGLSEFGLTPTRNTPITKGGFK